MASSSAAGRIARNVDAVLPLVAMLSELEALAGRLIAVGYRGSMPRLILDALSQNALGGVILFARNLPSGPRDAVAITNEILDASVAPAMIAIDQEGGRVARLKEGVLKLPPMRRLGERDDVEFTRRCAALLGKELAALGISMNFAPILDVDTNPENPVIGDRSFSSEPQKALRHAMAFGEGLMSAGVAACGKHFPGHGDTDLDSHLALPRLSHSMDRLNDIELLPFRGATTLPAWMSAHVVFDALEENTPATLSRASMTELIRGDIGYEGLLISDDLEMKAVRDLYPIEVSAVKAIEAGCDQVLICSETEAYLDARRALVSRAKEDASFRERMHEADERGRALRARFGSQTPVWDDGFHKETKNERRQIEFELAEDRSG